MPSQQNRDAENHQQHNGPLGLGQELCQCRLPGVDDIIGD